MKRNRIAFFLAPLAAVVTAEASAPDGSARGSIRETLEVFRRLEEPGKAMIPEARRLRKRFSEELDALRPRRDDDAAYFASLPHYVTALEAMDKAIYAAVDFCSTSAEKDQRTHRYWYMTWQAQLEILAEEIDRIWREK